MVSVTGSFENLVKTVDILLRKMDIYSILYTMWGVLGPPKALCRVRLLKCKMCSKVTWVWENNGWKFSNLAKDVNLHIQEAEKTSYRRNPKKFMPRYIIIKLVNTKTEKKILKAAREKWCIIYRERQFKGQQISRGGQQELAHFSNAER